LEVDWHIHIGWLSLKAAGWQWMRQTFFQKAKTSKTTGQEQQNK